jgi:uncharacterized membrane protein
MMKRLFWFLVGAVAGAYAVLWGKKKATEVAESLTPEAIARSLFDAARALVRRAIALYKNEEADPPPSVL